METHGSESYFVIGEGLLSESIGGRDSDGTARVASATATAADAVPPFRFSRMGPNGSGKQISEAVALKVGREMAAGGGGSGPIPAGFTYLGQFIDHDLTFDKTTVMLGQNVSPAQMLQARSPALDLDSLYGAGPGDPESAKFYSDDRHLKMGKTVAADGFPAKNGFDLPRGDGNTAAKKRKAIIPDPRNDENLAVAQTHLAMIRFHNRIVDTLPTSVPPSQRFAKARELAVKHYQWMIKTDYLPRICAQGVINSVFNNNQRKVFEPNATPTDVPTMPIEFSVAGFRLGHSMIRAAYNWNKAFDFGAGILDWLFIFSATGGDLGGLQRLAANWTADFRRLYDFGEANKPNLEVGANRFNRAMRIDTALVDPLKTLPPETFGGNTNMPFNDKRRNLAFRNLMRARMVKLATGQQMATFMKNKGVNLTKLTKKQIRDGKNGADLSLLTQPQREAFLKDTPLWFYVLREAEINNGKLKGVGARIVVETLHRAMEGSEHSIVRDTTFKPSLGPNNSTFRMVDLMLFAFEGKKNLLAPLG
jgi:Animal haem peroxidase